MEFGLRMFSLVGSRLWVASQARLSLTVSSMLGFKPKAFSLLGFQLKVSYLQEFQWKAVQFLILFSNFISFPVELEVGVQAFSIILLLVPVWLAKAMVQVMASAMVWALLQFLQRQPLSLLLPFLITWEPAPLFLLIVQLQVYFILVRSQPYYQILFPLFLLRVQAKGHLLELVPDSFPQLLELVSLWLLLFQFTGSFIQVYFQPGMGYFTQAFLQPVKVSQQLVQLIQHQPSSPRSLAQSYPPSSPAPPQPKALPLYPYLQQSENQAQHLHQLDSPHCRRKQQVARQKRSAKLSFRQLMFQIV